MSDRSDSIQTRSIQFGAVILALSVLFVLAQTLTSESHSLHEQRANEEFSEGRFAEARGDCMSAIEHYRTGLELTELELTAEETSYRLALARCLIKEGRTSEGGAYLSQVLAATPTDGEANLLRATLLAQGGEVDQAILFYERATSGSWPTDSDGRFRARSDLVQLLHGQRRWRDLVPQLMQLRENPSVDDQRRLRIAQMFMDAQAPGEARDMLAAMVQNGVERADVEALLGRAYLARRQPQQALTALRAARKLAPDQLDIANDAGFAEAIVSLDPEIPGLSTAAERRRDLRLVRIALERFKRCAPATGQGLAEQAGETIQRAERRRDTVEAAELRSLAVALWQRAGGTCMVQSNEERAVEYLLPDLAPAADSAVPEAPAP